MFEQILLTSTIKLWDNTEENILYLFFTATRNAFSRVGVKIWNGIPATLRKSAKKSFKESLKGKLFDILETVDSKIAWKR